MAILLSNCSPTIPKSGIFGPKFRLCCFFVKFCKQTNMTVLILNMAIVFLKIQPKNTQIRHFCQKYQNKAFWSQIQVFLCFRKISQLDKFDGADFKYGNIVCKFQPQNTQRHFWSKVRDFCFFVKFCKQTNLRVLILNMAIVFLNILSKNT